MDDNLTKILVRFEQLKGQFVLSNGINGSVERLLAIGDDGFDYYYVLYSGKKVHWQSCVGRIVPLKGKIDDEHYNEFIRLAKLNHLDQPTVWGHDPDENVPRMEGDKRPPITYLDQSIAHKIQIEDISEPHKYLTKVCWDLN